MRRRGLKLIRHWLLQIASPIKPPSIQITSDAQSRLFREMSEIRAFEPVATILWASEERATGPDFRWSVAFYDLDTRPSGRVVNIRGVPFIFVQKQSSRLNGATLDHRDGRFVVEGARQ